MPSKKKKEICPYCGRAFVQLSRHKCKIKERVEASEDNESISKKRIELIEEKRKEISRTLKKDEKKILGIINREKELMFEDLVEKSGMRMDQVENILDLLIMRSMVKVNRELIDSAWRKRIFALENYENEISLPEQKIDMNRKDFLWNMFGRQPCFICPFTDKCNETNYDQFNPYHCPWLSQWIATSLEGKEYNVNFEQFKEEFNE
ncbi:MAG: hypothetical protein ACTSYC_07320 [Promethearchaeota archaeon]